MAAVPDIFNHPGAAFVLLHAGIKFPPIEKEWQKPEKAHTFAEATAHKGNVGAVAGNGYIGLDQDDPDAFQGLKLAVTTTWETRPGRLGMRFACDDCTPEVLAKHGFKKPDQAQIKLYDGRRIESGYHPHVGEVKLQRTYQVIPPSWKMLDGGVRADYKLLDSTAPAKISLDWLLSELTRLGIVFSDKPRHDANAAKLGGARKAAADKKLGTSTKAREFLLEAALRATPGHRNDAGFWLACQLRDLGMDAGEASEYLRKFAISLDNQKGEPYTQDEAMNSLGQAYSKEPRDPPERQAGDLLERINADPRALKDPAILAALAALKIDDPIEYDLLIELIRKTHRGIKIDTIRGLVDKHVSESEITGAEPEDIPEDIQKIAARIAERGKPLKFMLNTFNQTHKGDRLHAESQFIGFGLQSAYNTKGVFGTWDGPSGKGKSDAAKACVRQLPEEYTIISSVTAKSLYHRAKNGIMLPATVLYLDDKNIEAGSDLEETLKRIQTFFQEGAEHETLDGKDGYVKTKLPPRLLVVRTYVDSTDTDTQLKNRSMDFGVDSSKETDNAVFDLVMKLGKDGQTTDMITRRTLICRALWRDIKERVYRVKHPAADQLIEMSDKSNRRNPSLFLDMVVGLVCIHHKQCDTEDGSNGEKILYSTYADYVEAARLFNSQGDYLGTRLDKAEFEAVQYIKEQGPEGAPIAGIFTHLVDKFPNDGWNTQRVRRLMDGRPDREIKGLVDTVPGIEPRWKVNDNGSKYKVYLIPGDLALGVRVKVHDPRTKPVSNEDLSHLSRRYPMKGKEENDTCVLPIHTTYPKYPKEKKEGDNTSHPLEEMDNPGKTNLSLCEVDFGKTGKRGIGNEALDAGKAPFPDGNLSGNDGKTGIDSPLVCAACGADLTGHSNMQKGDKHYCLRPGCGYPARDEAKAT